MLLQNTDVTCEVPLRDPFCYVPSAHGCIHLAFTSALAWDFPPSISISFHFPFASISPFLATHHCLSALFSPVTPQHQFLLLEQPVSHHHQNMPGSSTAALPFLLPLGEWGAGRGDWDHKHRCISGQSCFCSVTMDAFRCMWYGPSSTLW